MGEKKNKPSKTGYEKVKVGTTYIDSKTMKVGDVWEGKFVELKEKPKYKGKKGETQKHLVLENDKGELLEFPSHWQLIAAAELKGEGKYLIECIEVGGKKDKKGGKTSSYKYEIGFKK